MRSLFQISMLTVGMLFIAGRAVGQQPEPTLAPCVEDGSYGEGRLRHHPVLGLIHPLCLGCGGRDAGDNCACHGSYKYPVPSQSTFFWPGIYSSDTMTQYISPLRYPGLKPIPEYWKLDPTDDTSPYSGYRY